MIYAKSKAKSIVSDQASAAVAASNERFYDHAVTFLCAPAPGSVFSYFGHPSDDFMPQDQWEISIFYLP
jgi:hypothetical protein